MALRAAMGRGISLVEPAMVAARLDLAGAMRDDLQRRLIDEVGQVGPGEAGRHRADTRVRR